MTNIMNQSLMNQLKKRQKKKEKKAQRHPPVWDSWLQQDISGMLWLHFCTRGGDTSSIFICVNDPNVTADLCLNFVSVSRPCVSGQDV